MVVIRKISRVHRWQQFPTSGDPPLGVQDYAICSNGKHVYFFGGWCGHSKCYHNSLHSLNVGEWNWRLLFATSDSEGPMKKTKCEMVFFHQSLLVLGGNGPTPENPQASSHYSGEGLVQGYVCTDEHHIYSLVSGELITCTSILGVIKSVAMVMVMGCD